MGEMKEVGEFETPVKTDQKGQTGQMVNFIRVAKHSPNRRNNNSKLVFWNIERTDQYKFQSYLEQNRFQRLFKEIDILGEGGFGKVYKVQHNLDQRTYAIKKIQIYIDVNQDFKLHPVYREIGAISQVLHKNVVRYFACWIEAIDPDSEVIDKVVKKIEKRAREKTLEYMQEKGSEDSSDAQLSKYCSPLVRQELESPLLSKTSRRRQRVEPRWAEKNILKILEDEEELMIDEDWNHSGRSKFSNESSKKEKKEEQKQDLESSSSSESQESSSSSSSQTESESESSSESMSEEKSYVKSDLETKSRRIHNSSEILSSEIINCGSIKDSIPQSKVSQLSDGSSEDSEDLDEESSADSEGSLYQLIEKGKNFITLNVMIQMEYCFGDTLRAFLDQKSYVANRKVIFHLFKQLLQGLKHIHEEGLIHRDIKPENIFIDKEKLQLKIGDFGLAKRRLTEDLLIQDSQTLKRNNLSHADLRNAPLNQSTQLERQQLKATLINCQLASANRNYRGRRPEGLNDEASLCAGTPLYQAPEQTMNQCKRPQGVYLTDKIDMYAAGLILYEMCCSLQTQHQRIQKFHSLKQHRKLHEEIFNEWREERDIILNITDPDPNKRASASYLLSSQTFQTWSFDMKL